MKLNQWLTMSVGVWGLAVTAMATAQPRLDVPASLEPWRAWVLYGEEYRGCPVRQGSEPRQRASHICAWPGVLAVEAEADVARFDQEWTLAAEDWVALPGDAQFWPRDVIVDGAPRAAVERNGRPAVRLGPGRHTVAGRLLWDMRPASIPVPFEVGLISLEVDGAAVTNPDLAQGRLWLGLREGDEQQQDRLEVRAYRLLSDGLPIRLETRIELDVAGQAREVSLGALLPIGFVGEGLSSPLPAELDSAGELRVQLRPGEWEIRLAAHAETLIESLTLPENEAPWPDQEILSYEAAPRLRIAALEARAPIDPGQAGVPQAWLAFPAFRVVSGETVTLVERSRNDAAEPNRLALSRDMWLDFDGNGYTVLDAVTGTMGSGWRLDMVAPYVMTMARNGDGPLLVTTGAAPGLQGVETRATRPGLTATGRLPAGGRTAVSGYAERFDRVVTRLNLPPSYRLVAAPGADDASGSWLSNWRLLDLFLVLIVTTAAWRLFGAPAGLLTLAAVVLIYQEPLAPRWAWLNVLAAIALVRAAPLGRLGTWAARYRVVSLAAVALLMIPFSIAELRLVVYPQFEQPTLQSGARRSPEAPLVVAAPRAEPAAARRQADLDDLLQRVEPEARALEETVVTAAARDAGAIAGEPSRYAPGALVQTGPGLPDWVWNRYFLSWAGPVEADQTHRLIVLSPWQLRLWRVAGVLLALALVGVLVGSNFERPMRWLGRGATPAALLVAALLAPDRGQAQVPSEFPSPALLNELKQRLIAPAPCHPRCAEFTSATIGIAADTLTVRLDAAVEAAVAVPVPVVESAAFPQTIAIDGVDAGWLYRSPDGNAFIELPEGVHELSLAGRVPPRASFALAFALPPYAVDVTAADWDVTGIVNGRLPSGAVGFVRRATAEPAVEGTPATVFPPFVRVTRRISLDLDWQVHTEIERVAPATGAFTLPVDLLDNEAVLTPGIEVTDERALAVFTDADQRVAWNSSLPLAQSLTLTAGDGGAWAERWLVAASHIWHPTYRGFAASPPAPPVPAFFVPEFYPRPGETLTIDIDRPEPASGDTIAFDLVDYDRSVGERSADSTLHLEYRSTQGGDHVIELPPGSELGRVSIDSESVPLELDGNRLEIQVTPGNHNWEIEWRDAEGVKLVSSQPRVNLGSGASNLYSSLSLPRDRWVLMTYGPTLGPAVLYWSELLVFVVAALLLGRLAISPLATYEWLLLGLGLSTFAWPVLFLFAVWAFAMRWRERSTLPRDRRWFNAAQIGLAILTVAALLAVVSAIPRGLLGLPDMQIRSPVEVGGLTWFADRSDGFTEPVGVVSVSLWIYKAAMLAWALWLSFALLKWLRWSWAAYSREGIWRGKLVPDT